MDLQTTVASAPALAGGTFTPIAFVKGPPRQVNPELGPIRFKRFPDGDWLLTNDWGDWMFVNPAEFERLTRQKLEENDPLRERLLKKNMLNLPEVARRAVTKLRQRTAFTNFGPNLHVCIVTLRCNYTCTYCHAASVPMDKGGHDMTTETARKVVDTIFQTTNPAINIEFQGGEPLANFEVVKFIINYAREKNRVEKKNLAFSLVSNLSLLKEEMLDTLIAPDIYICTSLDGPKWVQEKNRVWLGGSSYDDTTRGMTMANEAYKARGFDPRTYHVDALLTTTRNTLQAGRDVVKEYLDWGIGSIHLRPLNPYGFVQKTWRVIGYGLDEFNRFYSDNLDYIIELNKQGIELIERGAAIYLQRILTDDDPNYMENRSPCGAAIGQIAYGFDGRVFTCDEGRMLDKMGDQSFMVGDVRTHGYHEMMDNDVVRAMAVASCQETVPFCHDCTYKPYCGICPIHNYVEQGSIVGAMPNSRWCQRSMHAFNHVFGLLKKDDPAINRIFERWISRRYRETDAGCAVG